VETETSWLGRIVSILTPFAAIAARWLAAWVAKHTGVQLDQAQITAFIVAAALSAPGRGVEVANQLAAARAACRPGSSRPRRETKAAEEGARASANARRRGYRSFTV
jgi:DNA-binding transcriptional regulator YbjK